MGGLNQEDGHRPPSPARADVPNTNTVVAGEGRGWGNNKLPSWRWHKNAINHTPQTPADGLNLEYGASAVFPCGVIPATDPQGRVPALGRLTNYGSRVI